MGRVVWTDEMVLGGRESGVEGLLRLALWWMMVPLRQIRATLRLIRPLLGRMRQQRRQILSIRRQRRMCIRDRRQPFQPQRPAFTIATERTAVMERQVGPVML